MHRILIASTVEQRLDRLRKGLGELGVDVMTANSSAQVWPQVLAEHFDALVVDASSSSTELDPWLLCGELQAAVKLPLVALIRPGRNHDRLRAFRAGALQCLAVPVSPYEVSASLESVLNPTHRPESKQTAESLRSYSDAWLNIDLSKRRICRGNVTLSLTLTESLLLEQLLLEAGNVVALETLFDAVWKKGEPERKCKRLKNYILRLRRKIEVDPSHPRYIVSQHGFGYAFMPQNLGLN